MAKRLALPTSDYGVAGSNPAGGEILPEPNRRLIAQSLSCSPFHRLEMTEILLKGRKTLTHPSIFTICCKYGVTFIRRSFRDDRTRRVVKIDFEAHFMRSADKLYQF